MVSATSKNRLQRAAQRLGGAARKAGSAYMDYSDRMADRMRDEADEAMDEAEEVVENDEPNDMEDVEWYRLCKRRHRDVMQKLDSIQDDVDELSRPLDQPERGTKMMGGSGFQSDFGFGGGGMAPDGYDDDGDWTRWL